MHKHQKTFTALILCLIFSTLFIRNVKSDFPLIFRKDLLAHDESSNSVVAANITRKFFPPMVRVNPLNEEQGNWMEGPYWQHIPPMFAYVPYLFFQLDGQVTIEVKRLSYALVVLLTGLLFIIGVYMFRKSLLAALAATLAAIFWINTPFTHELITGYAFGVSDIVLAFTVVCSFCALLWYLMGEKEERIKYPFWKLIIISIIVALPIMAKNLLGAIPAAAFFVLLFRDRNKKGVTAALGFVAILTVYYIPFYFSSLKAFKNEILVSFLHFKNLEGWARPWHHYLTNYLPQRYLFGWTWIFYLGLVLGIRLTIKDFRFKFLDRKDRILLWLSGGWFMWNLVAISLVESKIANFIYQSYLLSLFFVVYAASLPISNAVPASTRVERGERDLGVKYRDFSLRWKWLIIALSISISFTAYMAVTFVQQLRFYRAQAYDYQTEHEKFYQIAEQMRAMGVNQNNLVIIHNPPNDCWFRYYILFLTGAESKTLLEMHFHTVQYGSIATRYDRVYFLTDKLVEIDAGIIQGLIDSHLSEIQAEIERIKKDKTSCQWLVPDHILNAL